jgi:hypothetical protein
LGPLGPAGKTGAGGTVVRGAVAGGVRGGAGAGGTVVSGTVGSGTVGSGTGGAGTAAVDGAIDAGTAFVVTPVAAEPPDGPTGSFSHPESTIATSVTAIDLTNQRSGTATLLSRNRGNSR